MNNSLIKNFQKLVLYYKQDETKNSFQINSIKKALQIIKTFEFEIKSIEECKNIKGFGKAILSKIEEILKTKTLTYFDTLDIEIVEENDLYQITGLGDKKIKELEKKNIKSINDLIIAISEKKYKPTHQIEVGLKYYKDFNKRIPREEIDEFKIYFDKVFGVLNLKYDITGSFRRCKKECGDIDLLVTQENLKEDVMKNIIKELLKIGILVKDGILTPTAKKKFMGTCRLPDENSINRRLDIRVIDFESYFPALLYFTGSDNLNKKMRKDAINLNMKLNEYGLFKDNKKLKVTSEKDIFDFLNLKYLEPFERI